MIHIIYLKNEGVWYAAYCFLHKHKLKEKLDKLLDEDHSISYFVYKLPVPNDKELEKLEYEVKSMDFQFQDEILNEEYGTEQ